MTFLHKSFPKRTPELTKVNLLSLYTVASELLSQYALSDRHREFGEWLIGFEHRRRSDDEHSEDERDENWVSYQLAVANQTANLTSQQVRQRFLKEDLIASIPDIQLLDDQRLFNTEQRNAIYRLGEGRCANPGENPKCEVDCSWDSFHADHVLPYSKGGRTTVANGQLLCASCNLKKGAKS